jgi:hypothetical protein
MRVKGVCSFINAMKNGAGVEHSRKKRHQRKGPEFGDSGICKS